MTYDPEIWLESTVRELKKYAENGLNTAVRDDGDNEVGLYHPQNNPNGIYQVVMEFPTPEIMRDRVPLPRTIIHFEIDILDNRFVGIGSQIYAQNYDPLTQTVTPQEAGWHQINFDVGIWTSDKAGGTTARMRAYQILNNLFHGSLGQKAFDASADGGDGRVEILRWDGGRFITEAINDVPTYRSIDGVLEVRVFSRTPRIITPPVPAIEEILQAPGLVITE